MESFRGNQLDSREELHEHHHLKHHSEDHQQLDSRDFAADLLAGLDTNNEQLNRNIDSSSSSSNSNYHTFGPSPSPPPVSALSLESSGDITSLSPLRLTAPSRAARIANTIAPMSSSESGPSNIAAISSAAHKNRKRNLRFAFPAGFRNEDEPVGWEVFTPLTPGSLKKSQNYIRTTKYTILSFIPLFLYSQFKRFYNIYFLLGALSVLYGSAALSPLSQIAPLVAVLFFAALKDLIEDYARLRSDNEANSKNVTVVRDGIQTEIKAQDLMKGDLILIKKNEKLSIDAIILASSLEDGTCFVETAELDGETNIKRKSAISALTHYNSFEDIIRVNVHIQCEQPNENLLSFEGRAKYIVSAGKARATRRKSFFEPEKHETDAARLADNIVDGPGVVPLNLNNLLLRGCVLRNTDFAWASVIYTGSDTKIIMNMNKPPQKESRLMKWLNWLVMGVFVYNGILLFGSTTLEYFDYKSVYENNKRWYLDGGNTDTMTKNFVSALFSYFGMYTYVIPISLFVMVEMDRYAQGFFMMKDLLMAVVRQPSPSAPPTEEAQMVFMKANNTNLNEDLATIEYIFSDKTGTLTRNEMKLSKWYLDGNTYHDMEDPGSFGRAFLLEKTPAKLKEQMRLFYRVIALCHTVIPSFNDVSQRMVYESQSPDETALVEAIANSKIFLTNRSKSNVTFTVPTPDGRQTQHVVEVLHTLEFDSTRKRMSVIARDTATGQLHLYCKGADNIILQRLDEDENVNSHDMLRNAIQALHDFSVVGLRTLCIAYRELDEDLYAHFRDEYEAAETALVDRDLRMAAACEKVEHGLTLLGCTAIEDRLQDDVPETIDFLLKAGIKLWLLTGDKQETAINIGQSSKLIQDGMQVIKLNSKAVPECGQTLDKIKIDMIANAGNKGFGYCLVIDGDSLGHVFSGKFEQKLVDVGVFCHSVICCRVSPLQKSQVVLMVKTILKKMTLAIGDGANDCPMIMSAHVGVGIMGREGTQAVRCSDFAFAEFRFLKRLLVVHGRWSYMRLASLIFYNFYKNLAFITPQFIFGFYSAWSGEMIYEEFFMTWFNLFYTSVPPLLLGIFEQDVSDEDAEKIPQLYFQCRAGAYWNSTAFLGMLIDSVYHSVVIFYGVYLMFGDEDIGTEGRTIGYWIMTFIFSNVSVAVVFAKLATVTHHWVWISWVMLFLSVVVFVLGAIIIEATGYGSVVGTYAESYSIPIFWLCLPVIVAICIVPSIAVKYARRQFWPSDADVVVEHSKYEPNVKAGPVGTEVEMVALDRQPFRASV